MAAGRHARRNRRKNYDQRRAGSGNRRSYPSSDSSMNVSGAADQGRQATSSGDGGSSSRHSHLGDEHRSSVGVAGHRVRHDLRDHGDTLKAVAVLSSDTGGLPQSEQTRAVDMSIDPSE
ncbi:unnamed protein product [Prorocentrum cordatum]|uniref:Uncharacterized protein n=1 Tax=Prorocentrum cordatum TaxID=2364126 RepID=A0ABN9QL29_9DINO|nr:unnamed protein product [Polarella glacialis]